MKVITILQPYATLIALREKWIETRGWKAEHLGPVLIHAGKSLAMIREAHQEPIKTILAKHGITRVDQLPLGMALALSRIKSYSRSECLRETIGAQERLLGNYLPRRWGWQLEKTRRLDTAFALRGAQGLFDWQPPAGFEWKFRDDDPDLPPETPEQRAARYAESDEFLRRAGGPIGRKYA